LKPISLKKNIIVSYISQAYTVLAGILVLPFYITEMGVEAYGLVGFFAMLQAIFNLLDLGLTPTIGRETARYRAGVHSEVMFSQLYRTLNLIFIGVAFLGGGVLFIFAGIIAQKWLYIEALQVSEVIFALQIMAISVALRWMTGLYRGVVTGSEQIVWLSGFNALIITLRFLVVFPVMWKFGAAPAVFFSYQMGVAIIEFIGLWLKANTLVPKLNDGQKRNLVWSVAPIKPYLKFTLSIALTSGIWIVVTQSDKLIMSTLLTLEDYGIYTLCVLIASGIMMISTPVSNPLMTRMVKLEGEGRRLELIKIYRTATKLVSAIAGGITIFLFFFSYQILLVWTGDVSIAEAGAPLLKVYAMGYGFLAIAAFPYYLQYAIGNIKLHIKGSILFFVFLMAGLSFAVEEFGMFGAGLVWLVVNFCYLFFWSAIVHKRYLPGLHLLWFYNDFIKIVLIPVLVAILGSLFVIDGSRLLLLFQLALVGLGILLSSSFLLVKSVKKVY
jgi:O-antigen/teichoic acid export membrane protein